MAYLYRHLRKDTLQPFYIGIGLKDDNYKRANTKSGRNKHWYNIVNKVGYEVEIMLDFLTIEEAYNKEKEFIALYGKSNNGGLLCNILDGGQGALGIIPWNKNKKASNEVRAKISAAKKGRPAKNKGKKMSNSQREKMIKVWNAGYGAKTKGRVKSESEIKNQSESLKKYYENNPHPRKGAKMSLESRIKMSKTRKGRTAWNKGLLLGADFVSHLKEHQFKKGQVPHNLNKKMSHESRIKLSNSLKGRTGWNKGLKMTEEFKNKYCKDKKETNLILQYKGDELISIYKSAKEASEKTGFRIECIRMAARKQYSKKYTDIYKGYRWERKKP